MTTRCPKHGATFATTCPFCDTERAGKSTSQLDLLSAPQQDLFGGPESLSPKVQS